MENICHLRYRSATCRTDVKRQVTWRKKPYRRPTGSPEVWLSSPASLALPKASVCLRVLRAWHTAVIQHQVKVPAQTQHPNAQTALSVAKCSRGLPSNKLLSWRHKVGGLLREKYLDREQEKEWEGLFKCLSFRNYKILPNCGCVSGSGVYLGFLLCWQQLSCKEQVWFHTLFPPNERLSVAIFPAPRHPRLISGC